MDVQEFVARARADHIANQTGHWSGPKSEDNEMHALDREVVRSPGGVYVLKTELVQVTSQQHVVETSDGAGVEIYDRKGDGRKKLRTVLSERNKNNYDDRIGSGVERLQKRLAEMAEKAHGKSVLEPKLDVRRKADPNVQSAFSTNLAPLSSLEAYHNRGANDMSFIGCDLECPPNPSIWLYPFYFWPGLGDGGNKLIQPVLQWLNPIYRLQSFIYTGSVLVASGTSIAGPGSTYSCSALWLGPGNNDFATSFFGISATAISATLNNDSLGLAQCIGELISNTWNTCANFPSSDCKFKSLGLGCGHSYSSPGASPWSTQTTPPTPTQCNFHTTIVTNTPSAGRVDMGYN